MGGQREARRRGCSIRHVRRRHRAPPLSSSAAKPGWPRSMLTSPEMKLFHSSPGGVPCSGALQTPLRRCSRPPAARRLLDLPEVLGAAGRQAASVCPSWVAAVAPAAAGQQA